MAEQVRVQVYEGLYRSQTEEFFERDATEAARHGWFPTEQTWTGSRLSVAYAYRTRASTPRAAKVSDGGARTLPTPLRIIYWAVVIATVLAALLLLVAVLATWGLDRHFF